MSLILQNVVGLIAFLADSTNYDRDYAHSQCCIAVCRLSSVCMECIAAKRCVL